MKHIVCFCPLLTINLTSYANTLLTIEGFDSYTLTDDLQHIIVACGSNAQPETLILQPHKEVGNSNAVCFELQFITAAKIGVQQNVCADSIVVKSGFGTLIHLATIDRNIPHYP